MRGFESRRHRVTFQIRHIAAGNPLLDALTEPTLAAEWEADAESRHEPGTCYLMVLAADASGAMVPAAWAGYRIEDENGVPVLRCCNNYVRRPFRGRTPELYAAAYRARHRLVVRRFQLPGVTYLYEYPIGLHEADGWVKDDAPGSEGMSEFGHYWWRLRWSPVRVSIHMVSDPTGLFQFPPPPAVRVPW